jgi:NDP-4-keto-2,6-dideoxyhexose 3-C-methyltransferase
MTPTVKTWDRCRMCNSPNLDMVLSLGNLALSTFPKPGDDLPRAPLDWMICAACDFVQLRHSVHVDQLFRQYWYQSGINEAMRAELADIAEEARRITGPLQAGDVVIDIGANDGTLLQAIGPVPHRIAYEPAHNLYHTLRNHCDFLVADFFPSSELGALQAKLITSIAMFYDLDDPFSFVQGVKRLLHPEGVWIVQFQDLLQMLQAAAVDNICHEHVTYPTLKDLKRLCGVAGLAVVDAERRAINGGSLRLYVRHEGVQLPTPRVSDLIYLEKDIYDRLQAFVHRVEASKAQIQELVRQAGSLGPVDVYGASTKFNTLSQYCGLDYTNIRYAVERSVEKWGRLTVTGIPIVSEALWRENPPPTTLIGIWQFRDQIMLRESGYLAEGGAFIAPLPRPEVIYAQLTTLREALG